MKKKKKRVNKISITMQTSSINLPMNARCCTGGVGQQKNTKLLLTEFNLHSCHVTDILYKIRLR